MASPEETGTAFDANQTKVVKGFFRLPINEYGFCDFSISSVLNFVVFKTSFKIFDTDWSIVPVYFFATLVVSFVIASLETRLSRKLSVWDSEITSVILETKRYLLEFDAKSRNLFQFHLS